MNGGVPMKVTAMETKLSNKRKFSGDRVIARCEIIVKTDDPFSTWNDVKTGHVVLNIRGGCLYVGEYFDEENIVKLFPKDGIGTLKKLTLRADQGPDVVLENIEIAFVRLVKEAHREGVAFRFANVKEEHLNVLSSLTSHLPAIGDIEEDAVPFEVTLSLESPRKFAWE
jgi:hypothetical protein